MTARFRHCLRFSKLALFGVSTGVAAAAVVYKTGADRENGEYLPTALASWTTNFTPSVKWDSNWDKRDPESLVHPNSKTEPDGKEHKAKLDKVRSTATRHIIMIRHGNYDVEGETDDLRILTALGKEQADMTGLRLKDLGHPYSIMHHSTMTRAIQTADIIAQHLPDVPRNECSMLREGAPIPPEPPVGYWKPEIKQFYQDGARIEAAFRKFFYRASPTQTEDSYEILVIHANVIRYFICRALQFPPEAWLRMSLYHGSLTWVAIRPNGRVTLRQLGNCGHMPPDKLTAA